MYKFALILLVVLALACMNEALRSFAILSDNASSAIYVVLIVFVLVAKIYFTITSNQNAG